MGQATNMKLYSGLTLDRTDQLFGKLEPTIDHVPLVQGIQGEVGRTRPSLGLDGAAVDLVSDRTQQALQDSLGQAQRGSHLHH